MEFWNKHSWEENEMKVSWIPFIKDVPFHAKVPSLSVTLSTPPPPGPMPA